ncbi:MAG: SYNERG-CTERM sorting domain-containing protein [Synergistaceae bacterium]|nr:SYNERG-CTERM sorting domain-containing protein [Synergistaceae bacterium]
MRKMLIVFAVIAVCSVSAGARAADITYPGYGLQVDPFGWDPNPINLLPGTTANPGLSGNTVTVNSGVIGGAVFGGVSAGSDDVTNNRVVINGGTVGLNIFGGWSELGSASHNTVTINGGTVTFDVIGGMGGPSGDATHNTVTISGSPTFGATTKLLGGNFGADNFTGNILKIQSGDIVVKGAENFEFINFYLPSSIKDGGEMLIVTDPVDLENVNIKITGVAWDSSIESGDVVTLITNVASGDFLASPDISGPVETTGGTWKFSADGGVLTATFVKHSEVFFAKGELAELIKTAEDAIAALKDTSKYKADPSKYDGAISDLQEAIDAANEALNDPEADEVKVKTAITALKDALADFAKAIKGSGGGCDAGVGLFALLALAVPFILKKRR